MAKAGRPTEWTDEKLHELGEELVSCVKEDEVWHLSEFAERHEKSAQWINELDGRSKIFSEYVTRARQILGRKLFREGIKGSPSAIQLKHWMPRWLEERHFYFEDVRDEAATKAEATRDAMTNDPDHPFWREFMNYMGVEDEKTSK